MGVRSMTVGRYEEIRRRLAEGRGLREIARALSCSRDTVREVRDGARQSPDAPKRSSDPLWMLQLDWPAIIHDLGLGHPLKFIWEEKAQHLTTYSNFWKQFYRKFPQYRQASVTAREFEPGERVEVDYAGDAIEWIELKTGEIRKAYVFVAGLGFSHLLFAWAAEDMKSRNWLGLPSAHVQLLRWCPARDGAGLFEAGRAQVPSVRSGSEPRLRTAGRLNSQPPWSRRVPVIRRIKRSSKDW